MFSMEIMVCFTPFAVRIAIDRECSPILAGILLAIVVVIIGADLHKNLL